MKDKIIGIINNENKYQPLTDEQIANLIGTTREVVTEHRRNNGIPNSRERINIIIYEDGNEILNDNPEISHRDFMRLLNSKGYNISRAKALEVLNKLKESKESINRSLERIKKSEDENTNISLEQKVSDREEYDVFQLMIGHDGSMRLQINQAKAAVLYPPKGLHTLILGPSGTGKSRLAELMYKFAITTENFTEESPFIIFNCADYADNPELLLSQLFGHSKGAYTGAEIEKIGLVEKANNGILFLDEIHRLPSKGQEILFNILDKGSFRRLGDIEERKVNLMIIAATTESPESVLLLTFRRRIPMVIEIPSLNQRTLSERYEIITTFLKDEAKRIKKNIIVHTDVLKSLMLYDCPGNIGQIRSDIQVACARGLLNTLIKNNNIVNIRLSDLPNHLSMGMLKIDRDDTEIEKYTQNPLKIHITDEPFVTEENNRYIMPNKIYQFIENRSGDLLAQGLNNNEVNLIVSKEIETELLNFAKKFSSSEKINKIELKSLVGQNIIEIVDQCYDIVKKHYEYIDESFYYSLAIHLSATYERLLRGEKITNPELRKIKEKYSKEYKIALEIVKLINDKLIINMPEEEIGFITMYIRNFSGESLEVKKSVSVIVLTHGKVGVSIVEVVNRLLNVEHAIGLEMSLDENPMDALERTIDVVKKVDQGKGCILLVDMGSLITFGNIITERTGIDVKVIDRVDTLLALEVTRKAIFHDAKIDDIISSATLTRQVTKHVKDTKNMMLQNKDLPKAIITICLTGQGTASKIQTYIEKSIGKYGGNINIISIGILSPVNLDLRLRRIMDNHNIISIVGTIDPELPGVPFISMQNFFENKGIDKLQKLIKTTNEEVRSIDDLLDEDMIVLDKDIKTKKEAIDFIIKKLQETGYVEQKFQESVYEREEINSTYSKGNIAIPHGFPQYVTKPAIFILRLKNDMVWDKDGRKIKIIFLIAYKKDSKKYFDDIYRVLIDTDIIAKMKEVKGKREIIQLMKHHARN